MTQPRILLFDIETSPLVGYAWRTYDTNLVAIKEEWHLLSIAWQWFGERKVNVLALPDVQDPVWDTPEEDCQLALKLAKLFDEADIVVAHNATKFDVPKTNARLAYWGIDPPSPYKVFDTLTTARKNFAFTSNRLDDLCQHLGLGQKAHHEGFGLWEKCMAGDEKAWKTMKRYNKHDVVLLERLYRLMRTWGQHPNLALMADKPAACPKCLAEGTLEGRGWRYNAVTKRQKFQCTKCRGWCAGRALSKSEVEHVA